jgi:hypothetical protein
MLRCSNLEVSLGVNPDNPDVIRVDAPPGSRSLTVQLHAALTPRRRSRHFVQRALQPLARNAQIRADRAFDANKVAPDQEAQPRPFQPVQASAAGNEASVTDEVNGPLDDIASWRLAKSAAGAGRRPR